MTSYDNLTAIRSPRLWPLYIAYACLFAALSAVIVVGAHAAFNLLEQKGLVYAASYGDVTMEQELSDLQKAESFEVHSLPSCFRFVRFSSDDFIMRETNMSSGDLDNARTAVAEARESKTGIGYYESNTYRYGALKIQDGSWVAIRCDADRHWVSRAVDEAFISPAEFEASVVGVALVILLILLLRSLAKKCRVKRHRLDIASAVSPNAISEAPEITDPLETEDMRSIDKISEDSEFDPESFALHIDNVSDQRIGTANACYVIASSEFKAAAAAYDARAMSKPSWTLDWAKGCFDALIDTALAVENSTPTCICLTFIPSKDNSNHSSKGSWWSVSLDATKPFSREELNALNQCGSSKQFEVASLSDELIVAYRQLSSMLETHDGIVIAANSSKGANGAETRRYIICLPA